MRPRRNRRFKLYHWDRKAATATELVSTATRELQTGYGHQRTRQRSLSRSTAARLFFGVAPPAEPEKEESEDATRPRKKSSSICGTGRMTTFSRCRRCAPNRNGTARIARCFTSHEKKYVQLADETMEGSIQPATAAGRSARTIARTDLVGYDDESNSRYFSGQHRRRQPQAAYEEAAVAEFTWSPSGQVRAVLRRQGLEHAFDSRRQDGEPDTQIWASSFWQEDHDSPSIPPPATATPAGRRTTSTSCFTTTTTSGRSRPTAAARRI